MEHLSAMVEGAATNHGLHISRDLAMEHSAAMVEGAATMVLEAAKEGKHPAKLKVLYLDRIKGNLEFTLIFLFYIYFSLFLFKGLGNIFRNNNLCQKYKLLVLKKFRFYYKLRSFLGNSKTYFRINVMTS